MFRRYLLAGGILTVGAFMQQTAQGWLVLELTNSEALLGLAGAVAGLPILLLAAFAGVLVDRLDRRLVMVAASGSSAVFAFTLAALTSLDLVAYWHVLVIALLTGLALTFQMPAAQAVVSSIVDRSAIGNAVALNSAQYNALRIVAPAAAGLFIAAGALELGFWVNGVALATVTLINASLTIPEHRDTTATRPTLRGELRDGIRFVTQNRVLAVLVLLPAVPALLILNYIIFIPIYARDILATGPAGLGLLTGSIGVGAAIGALSLATLRPSGGSGRLLLTGLGIVGLALTTFAVSRSLPISMAALALVGMFQVTFYSTTNTLIQVLVPAALRGRVLSLYLLTSIGLIPVGNLIGGAIAEVTGVEPVLAGGGILAVVLAIAAALYEPRLARLRGASISAGGGLANPAT
jgi:MFS family permease